MPPPSSTSRSHPYTRGLLGSPAAAGRSAPSPDLDPGRGARAPAPARRLRLRGRAATVAVRRLRHGAIRLLTGADRDAAAFACFRAARRQPPWRIRRRCRRPPHAVIPQAPGHGAGMIAPRSMHRQATSPRVYQIRAAAPFGARPRPCGPSTASALRVRRRRAPSALVGESGCGKSTTRPLVLGLVPPDRGHRPAIDGAPHAADPARRTGAARAPRMQMVYQDPLGALDRRLTIRDQVARTGRYPRRSARNRSATLRRSPCSAASACRAHLAGRYPHELSGGQRQRVVLARALMTSAGLPRLRRAGLGARRLDPGPGGQSAHRPAGANSASPMLFISHDLARRPAGQPAAWRSCISAASSRRARPMTSSPTRATPTPGPSSRPPPRRVAKGERDRC